MISHEKATLLNSKLGAIQSKLVYPPQNLVDLIWKAKPVKPDAAIYIQSTEFAGVFSVLAFLVKKLITIIIKFCDFQVGRLNTNLQS